MNRSESIGELATAMALAQTEISNAAKNAENPFFKSKYADLAEILNVVRPIFSKNGIAIIQSPSIEGDVVSVETMLVHKSGEWISGIISCPAPKKFSKDHFGKASPEQIIDIQSIGLSITYLRRYGIAPFCCVAQEDDDGNHYGDGIDETSQKGGKKISISDERFARAIKVIEEGRNSIEKLRLDFIFTEDQEKTLALLASISKTDRLKNRIDNNEKK